MVRASLLVLSLLAITWLGGCGETPPPPPPAAMPPAVAQSSSEPSSSGESEGSASGGGYAGGSNESFEVNSGGSNSGGYGNGGYNPGPQGNTAQSGSGSDGYGADYMASQGGYGQPGSNGQSGYGSEGGYPGAGGQRRPPAPKKLTLKERSVIAFQAGNTRRAQILMGAYALQTTDEEATEIASNYRWANHRATKRPLLGVNVAVGAIIKNPRNISDLAPIGSDSNNAGSGGMEGMYGGGMGTPGGSSGSQDKKTFAEVTGAIGKKLASSFSEKHSDGVWSPAFQEYTLSRNRPGMQNQMNGGYGINYGSEMGSEGSMPAGPAGGIGLSTEAPFFQAPGAFGFDPYAPGGNSQPPIGMIPGDTLLPTGHTAIAPGLTYLGSDEQSKLIKKATQAGFDCLILFELDIKQNQMLQKTLNETRMRAVLPREAAKDVKSIGASKVLNNLQAAKAKASGSSDGVDEAVELIIKKLEENLALVSIPSLSPVPTELTLDFVVKQRIPQLVDDKDKELTMMERLLEVNFYYLKGFIDEKEKADAFEKIAGTSGLQAAEGSTSDRRKAVEKLLEKEFK
jgi:hypothetical protein